MGWLASTKEFFRKVCGQDGPGPTFTPRAQQVFALADKEAERLHHSYIGTEHVLLGLIKLGQGVAYNVLGTFGLNLENVRREIEKQVGTGPPEKPIPSPPYTPRVKKALAWAREEARALHHTYIGTEHLLLGLLREGDGLAAQVLRNCGADLERMRVATLKELNPNYNSDDEFYTRHFAQLRELPIEKATNEQNPQERASKTGISPQEPGPQNGDAGFTPRALQVLALAKKEAERLHHNYVSSEHLLLGLIGLGAGGAYDALKRFGLNPENVRKEVEKHVGPGLADKPTASPPYSPRLKKILDLARREAKVQHRTHIDTEHLLLGLLRDDDNIAAQILKNCWVNRERVRTEVLSELDPNFDSDDKIDPQFFVEVVRQHFLPQVTLKFTLQAQEVLALARKEADRLNDNSLGVEHLLAGLIALGNGISAHVLIKKGMTLEKVRADLEATRPGQKMFGDVPYTARLKRVVRYAREKARVLNHTYIGTDHLLLGLLTEDRGPAVDLFKQFGVDMDALHQEILDELNPPKPPDPPPPQ